MKDEQTFNLLQRAVAKGEAALGRLRQVEARAQARLDLGFSRFKAAAGDLAQLTRHGTGKESGLQSIVKRWLEDEETTRKAELETARAAALQQQQALDQQRQEIAALQERLANQAKSRDELVAQVFVLTDAVRQALQARSAFLCDRVYPMLIDSQGRLRSQITFDSEDQLRRVVVLVNHLSKVDAALAAEAKAELETFFRRFSQETAQDENVRALLAILEKVLVERVQFKVGPDLYRFLGLDLTETRFPELKKAQMLLRTAMRSEKTSSYIRLFERKATNQKWIEVKLT